MPLHIGNMNQRITIQRPESTRDGVGDEVIEWVTVATTWAEVRPFVAAERYIAAADQEQAKGVYQVQMYWRDGISVTWRLLWRDLILNITSMEDRNGRRDILTLMCEAVLP